MFVSEVVVTTQQRAELGLLAIFFLFNKSYITQCSIMFWRMFMNLLCTKCSNRIDRRVGYVFWLNPEDGNPVVFRFTCKS